MNQTKPEKILSDEDFVNIARKAVIAGLTSNLSNWSEQAELRATIVPVLKKLKDRISQQVEEALTTVLNDPTFKDDLSGQLRKVILNGVASEIRDARFFNPTPDHA